MTTWCSGTSFRLCYTTHTDINWFCVADQEVRQDLPYSGYQWIQHMILFYQPVLEWTGLFLFLAKKYRDNTCTLIRRDSTLHGPCSNGIFSTIEYDYAHCFASGFWHSCASSWIDRCHSWPPSHVVNDIVRSGCHFVPIGYTLGNHADNEWRISFSQAEQKLVFAINHTQFFVYGLLKLFVKEINNGLSENEKLLCSYQMKTAIFWALQQNTIAQWCPQNLLAGFWVCFKLLLKLVYVGVCPNFFVPENNMFLNKVHGVAQKNLFARLYGWYEKGIPFLLHCRSIRMYIIVGLFPGLSICTDEHTMISEVALDKELFNEIQVNDAHFQNLNLHRCMEYIQIVEQLIRSPLTEFQIPLLWKLAATIFQSAAFILNEMYTSFYIKCQQIYVYCEQKVLLHAEISSQVWVSFWFFVHCYVLLRNIQIQRSTTSFNEGKGQAQSGLIYVDHVDPDRYTEAVGGQSWSAKIDRL